MNDDLKVFCKNTNEYIDIDGGDTPLSIFESIKTRLNGINPICARVNNRTQRLGYHIYSPSMVEFLDTSSTPGYRVYLRSLCMIMFKAVKDLYPTRRLIIVHSVSGGYYCRFKHDATAISDATVAAVKARMREIIDADMPFMHHERLTTDVIELFRKQGMPDKVRLLESSNKLYASYYKLGDLIDSYMGPLAPTTGRISVFDLVSHKDGMLLLPPDKKNLAEPAKPVKQQKLFQAMNDYTTFNCIIGIADVGELNKAIDTHHASDLINVAEALHNQAFARIAADIAERNRQGGAKVVMVAGPSSSGKTTSAKRLSIQLITNYIIPKVISLDNYFVNRENTPRDESGDYDYESLYALDLEQLNSDINDLIAGKEVKMPTYNFKTGKREYKGNTLKLDANNILLMEGIHGLNPELTKQIADDMKYRVYVSALTTLTVDDHNWIPTTDNRLLRRIVRDYKYRGESAQSTIARWPSVRRGEEKWIFPFQENADAMFNSSLLFELAVMKNYALPILSQVPANTTEYDEAQRLITFLNMFHPLAEKDIPSTSLLREFLGGSSFHY